MKFAETSMLRKSILPGSRNLSIRTAFSHHAMRRRTVHSGYVGSARAFMSTLLSKPGIGNVTAAHEGGKATLTFGKQVLRFQQFPVSIARLRISAYAS
jgi:hypothetical protein